MSDVGQDNKLSMSAASDVGSPFTTLVDALDESGYDLDWGKSVTFDADGIEVTRISVVGFAASVTFFRESGVITSAHYAAFTSDGMLLRDWPVCHVPPGSEGQARTIYVDNSAIQAHREKHGDTLGFCSRDAAAQPDLGVTTVVVAEGAPPITGRIVYDDRGDPVVAVSGKAAGTDSLAELTRIKPAEEIPEEPSPLPAFTERARETLGEAAAPILETIPVSMGGTGPEIDLEEVKDPDRLISPLADVPCLPGECPDEDLPSDGDPGDQDGGGEQESGEEDAPAEGDPEDSGDGGGPDDGELPGTGDPEDEDLSYDPDILLRLEGDVEHWARGVFTIQAEIGRLKGDLEAAREEWLSVYNGVVSAVVDPDPDLATTEAMIRGLDEDIDNVNGDLDGDIVGIALGIFGVFTTCPTSFTPVSLLAGAACAATAGGTDYVIDSYKGHRAEKAEYLGEREDLVQHRDLMLADANAGFDRLDEITEQSIVPLEEGLNDANGLLELAEAELETAEEDLASFKQIHGID